MFRFFLIYIYWELEFFSEETFWRLDDKEEVLLESCIFCSEYSVLNLAPIWLFIIPNVESVGLTEKLEAVCDGIVKCGGTTSLGGKNGKGAKDTAGLEWLGPILENIIIISFFFWYYVIFKTFFMRW